MTTPNAPQERTARIANALAAIEEGRTLTEIAEGLGVTPQAISAFLLSNVPEEYRALQERGLIARIVEADQKLENASSHLEVARTREIAKFRRWDAERRLKHLFGPSQEIGAPGAFKPLDNLERARRYAYLKAVVEREPIDAEILPPSTAASS